MASRIHTVTVDCADPARLAEFWAAALGWSAGRDDGGEEAWAEPADGAAPPLLFVRVPEEKAGKNRIHLDLAPDDQEAEVRRLEGLGATRVDVGQRDVSWVVLADPEGNEFCVLTPR